MDDVEVCIRGCKSHRYQPFGSHNRAGSRERITASIERRAKWQNIDRDDQFALSEYKEALETRQTELGHVLRDLEAFPHHSQSAKWWQLFKTHNILPFPGSWLEQPAWWTEDVEILELLDEYHNLPYEIEQTDKQLKEAAKRMIDRAMGG